jgi:uncharacterized protein YjbI with pentapeptide repeats
MKTLKPDNMSIIFKSFSAEEKEYLSVAASAFFSLDAKDAQERLFHEQQMWPAIEASLGKNEVFDFGMPKERGEFLVYGSCFSPIPVQGFEVSVNVGNSSKSLVVLGNMHWTVLGVSDSEPFTFMPVDYSHAFGGEGFAKNPIGKGLNPNEEGRAYLPNIQDKNCLMGSCNDRPDPVGFAAYPMTWPQRMQYFGVVDENYLLESWPHFPKGTDPEYFNTAPQDQRINGFFAGDEKIEIHNMHPAKPVLNSNLPGLRARIFVHVKEEDNEVFKEINARPETLWLFPDKERGILLFRSSTEVSDEDFSNVLHCFARWENLSEEPKPIDYYYRLFQEELNPAAPVEETAESPAEKNTMEESPPEAPHVEETDPQLDALVKEAEKLEANVKEQLKKLGLTPEEVLKKYVPPPVAETPTTLDELELMVVGLEKQMQGVMKQFNITGKDIAKMMEPKPQTPPASVDKAIADLRKAGIVNPGIEAHLREAERLSKEAEKEIDALRKMTEETEKAAGDIKEPVVEKPPEAAPVSAAITVEEVMKRYSTDKNLRDIDLTGLDLTGLDLIGADFTGSILEKTILTNTKLDRAILDRTRLAGADFSGASIKRSRFNEAIAPDTCFRGSDMREADLSAGDFTGADFTKADLTGAVMNNATFERCSMNEIIAVKVIARKVMFNGADITDGNLTGADIEDADFSDTVLSFTNFMKAKARGIKLFGAKGEKTFFGFAVLDKSRADIKTTFTDADIGGANVIGACWEGANLQRAQMMKATLDESDFSGCVLQNAVMSYVTAKKTNFSKADLSNANMTAINFFKGSFRKSILVRTDLKYSNLFGVDFYKAKLGKTRLTGANTKRTILIVRP